MSLRFTLALITCLSVSACATVDLDEMAAAKTVAKTNAVKSNVVQRAAMKLKSAFSSRGFVAKDSQKRMQSAAHILLKGLEDQEIKPSTASYVTAANDPMIVLADIRTASRHVEQTTKAAEVYLAMAPVETTLRKELNSLEDALLASRAAETIFEDALIKTGYSLTASEFLSYNVLVEELKDVTNAFGDRVRESALGVPSAIN